MSKLDSLSELNRVIQVKGLSHLLRGGLSHHVSLSVNLRQKAAFLLLDGNSNHAVLSHVSDHSVDQVLIGDVHHVGVNLCHDVTSEEVVDGDSLYLTVLHQGARASEARETRQGNFLSLTA